MTGITDAGARATPVTRRSRLEAWLIGAVVLFGTVLRAWRLSGLGLIHFDEGVYAISGLWTVAPQPQLYPKQVLFSPPLYFSLVGTAYRLLGAASDQAAILVNVLIGALTIGLVGWLGRRWFGGGAGIAAAVLLALSDYHIAYSRMALTDITFGFAYLLSLATIALTLERQSLPWAIVSGLAIGAAMNTKYHGWLPLVVTLVVLVVSAVLKPRDVSAWKRRFACWMVMTAMAAVCYLPWVAYVHSQPGGYPALMQYQRDYLSRFWLDNLRRHMDTQRYMSGWLSRLSPGVAYLLALVARGDRGRLNSRRVCLSVVLLTGAGLALGSAGTAAAMSLLAVVGLVRRGGYLGRLLLASLGLLFVMTPFYLPYPRLLLPWLLSAYVAAGLGLEWFLVDRAANRIDGESRLSGQGQAPITVLVSGVALVLAMGLAVGGRPTVRTWMETSSLREATRSMVRMLPEASTVLVHGEPAVAFYLRLHGYHAIPIDDPIDHPDVSTQYDPTGDHVFLVAGIYAQHRDPGARAHLERLGDRLRLMEIFAVQPNDVRLLNDFTPSGALRFRLFPTEEYALYLYEVAPLAMQERTP